MRPKNLPLLITTTLAVLLSAVGIVTLFALRQSADATHQPLLEMGIDADSSGNTANSLGTIESCRSVAVGETFDVDVYVKGVPVANFGRHGLAAFGGDLLYDPALIRVDAFDTDYMLAAVVDANIFLFADTVPDSDGRFNVNAVDLSTNYEFGDGVLVRISLTPLANGNTTLELFNLLTNTPNWSLVDAESKAYAVSTIISADIRIGETCPAPSPTPDVSPSTATFYGTVRNNQGDAVTSGRIDVLGPSGFAAAYSYPISGEGTYVAKVLPASYYLRVTSDGYTSECWTSDGGSAECEMPPPYQSRQAKPRRSTSSSAVPLSSGER